MEEDRRIALNAALNRAGSAVFVLVNACELRREMDMTLDRRVFLASASLALPGVLPGAALAAAPVAPQVIRADQRWIESGRLSVITDPWGRVASVIYLGPYWREPHYLNPVGSTGLYFGPARQFLSAKNTGPLAFDQAGASWTASHFEVAGFALELLQMVQDAPDGNYSELIQRYTLSNISGTRKPFSLVQYVDAWMWPSDDTGSVNIGVAEGGGTTLFAYSNLFKRKQPHVGLMLQGAGTPSGYAIAEDNWGTSNLPQDIPSAKGLPADRLNRVHGDADGDGRTDAGQYMLSAGLALQRELSMTRGGFRQQLTVRIRFGNGSRS